MNRMLRLPLLAFIVISSLANAAPDVDPQANAWTPACNAVQPDIARGAALVNAQRGDEAVKVFGSVTSRAPLCSVGFIGLGDGLSLRKSWSEALAAYTRANVLGFSDPVVHLRRGICLLKLKRTDDAIAVFETAERAGMNNWELFGNLAWAHNQKHQFELAAKYGYQSVELEPGHEDVLHNLGISLEESGRHDEAIKIYTKAIGLRADDSEAIYNRGVAYMRSRHYDLAIEDFTKSVELDPKNADALVLRGESSCRDGKPDLASPDYEAALRVLPTHSDAQWLLRHLDLCRPEFVYELERRP